MNDSKNLSERVEKENLSSESSTSVEAAPSLSESIVVERGGKPRQKSYVLDLRIHSPASLGYLGIEGIDTAPALVRLAKVKGLNVIAVTDFYSGHYIDRIMAAAVGSEVTVIPGVVIRCCVADCDDVTLSCLFPLSFNTQKIEEFLGALEVPASAFGNRQYLVKMPFKKILSTIESFGGIALPSRMDKTPHRMNAIPTLVDEYGIRTFDLAYHDSSRFFKKNWPKTKFNLFSFSNANALAQVGSRTARVKLLEPSFEALSALMSREEKGSGKLAEKIDLEIPR
jgi:hypothetical protein